MQRTFTDGSQTLNFRFGNAVELIVAIAALAQSE